MLNFFLRLFVCLYVWQERKPRPSKSQHDANVAWTVFFLWKKKHFCPKHWLCCGHTFFTFFVFAFYFFFVTNPSLVLYGLTGQERRIDRTTFALSQWQFGFMSFHRMLIHRMSLFCFTILTDNLFPISFIRKIILERFSIFLEWSNLITNVSKSRFFL